MLEATSLPPKICAQIDPPPSEKRYFDQYLRIGSRLCAFQQVIDEVCTLPLTAPKGGSKSEFVVFVNKIQVQLNKVCHKISLRENFQRQSCSKITPLSNDV